MLIIPYTEHEAADTPAVISLADYGARPDSAADTQLAMRLAIEAAAMHSGPVVLDCPKGSYHFYPDAAIRLPYHISNTASEEEQADVLKTIGLLLKGMRDFTLEGNGSLFIFHGKQTLFLLDGCTNVEIRDLHTDYACPTVVEMTVEACGNDYFDVRVHPDFRYEIGGGGLDWIGEGWSFREGPMQVFDPVRNTTRRIDNWLERAVRVEEIRPMLLRLYFDFTPDAAAGTVLQARDGIRDQVGAFITGSTDIRFHKVGMHFMHGLGIVGQFSRNLSFQKLDLSPRPETGRTAAGFADFIHLSGCGGKVRIEDSSFAGAHDDAINVHGTYLRIIQCPAANMLRVRFMHHQTYGFQAFHPGDAVDFVRTGSLTVYASNVVTAAEWLNPRELLLTLADPVPGDIGEHDVVENVTWTPEVGITGNRFARIPTRGILVTTRRRVVITGNIFERMAMSGILIAVDAESWYESGRVTNVTIAGNRFIECGGSSHPVILIAPENKLLDKDAPVHRNVVIENNRFVTRDAPILSAKSTKGLTFKNNEILAADTDGCFLGLEDAIALTACSEVEIADNSWIPVPAGKAAESRCDQGGERNHETSI